MRSRHLWTLPVGHPRAAALLFRAWCWYGPLYPNPKRRALSRILEDV